MPQHDQSASGLRPSAGNKKVVRGQLIGNGDAMAKVQKPPNQEEQNVKRQELARKLLQNPDFFEHYFDDLKRGGLIGEERNAAILLVAGVSRLFPKPINLIIKGCSSSGKNHLVKTCLRLFPKDSVRELTSSSTLAWNYSGDDFRNRIVYLQERNEASGAVHPARLLISEGRLIRNVTVREGGTSSTKTFVAEGPICSISTTTSTLLEIDDETRNLSLFIDETEAQTKRIVVASVSDSNPLTEQDLLIWHEVHRLLEDRSKLPIILPKWFEEIAHMVYGGNVRVRRYFHSFATAMKVIALVRSFQKHRDPDVTRRGTVEIEFEDFCLAEIIFEPAFAESLHRGADDTMNTRQIIEKLAKGKKGVAVGAGELASELGISIHKAYAKIRNAADCGAIFQANAPERANKKLFLPSPQPRFIPSPEEVLAKIPTVGEYMRFVHPFTGEWAETGSQNE